MENIKLIVNEGVMGERADVYITQALSLCHNVDIKKLNCIPNTRNAVQKLIINGNVYKNNLIIYKPSTILREGDEIQIIIPPPTTISAEPQEIPLDIIYQDADIAIINKQRGIVVHPAAGNYSGTLVNALMYHLKDLSSINGTIRPGIIHRLDKNTTGLMVVAKNDNAHINIANQFSKRNVIKKYIALLDGKIKITEGEITAPIGRCVQDRKKMAVVSNGRDAKTKFKVIDTYNKYSLVEFTLITGRTHQIRVHAKYIKHPVVGDEQYGGSNILNLKGQLLHASYLEFTHPKTNKVISFSAEIPQDFKDFITSISTKNK
ncbi:MAG TPA: RluA family pseudouridine synthase [Clostridia bacterium]|jgi:23S rRNA pseudouridine1911/1915/1917 synthase|nr:RluA family pseudouridine synthase [Clostridia bacterium]